MLRSFARTSLIITLLATAACSQPAARVDMMGQNVYGRSGTTTHASSGNSNSRSYASAPYSAPKRSSTKTASNYKPYEPAPIYTNTRPIGNVPMETEKTASVQSIGVSDLPPPASSKSGSVNNWTKKARSEETREQEESKNLSPQSKKYDEHSVSEVKLEKPAKFTSAASNGSKSYMWPVNSRKVVSGFGPKGAGKANDGINIASAEGEPVWASADGEVVYSGNELQGYGNMVLIKHPGGKSTSYAHLSRATVDKYDRVKQGDIIGYVGTTGNVKKPQLHFAIRDGKSPVDPRKFLSTNVAGL